MREPTHGVTKCALWTVKGPECTIFLHAGKEKSKWGPSLTEVLDSYPKEIFPDINCLFQILIMLLITKCTLSTYFQCQLDQKKESKGASQVTL